MTDNKFLSELDPGIRDVVIALRDADVQTCQSCEGGDGHAYRRPTVEFFGDENEMWRVFAICTDRGWQVRSIGRDWAVHDGRPEGVANFVSFSSLPSAT